MCVFDLYLIEFDQRMKIISSITVTCGRESKYMLHTSIYFTKLHLYYKTFPFRESDSLLTDIQISGDKFENMYLDKSVCKPVLFGVMVTMRLSDIY